MFVAVVSKERSSKSLLTPICGNMSFGKPFSCSVVGGVCGTCFGGGSLFSLLTTSFSSFLAEGSLFFFGERFPRFFFYGVACEFIFIFLGNKCYPSVRDESQFECQ